MTDLVSGTTRGIFRNLMTDVVLGAIESAFQDEGLAPNPDSRYNDSSIRRVTTQAYLEGVDWTDGRKVARFLVVAERLLHGWEPDAVANFWRALRRDGYELDAETGRVSRIGTRLDLQSLSHLSDPSAILEQLERIRRAVNDDPALAVGSAKELIESTAKVVLIERGWAVNDKDDLPALARAAQEALALHPAQIGPDGSGGIKRILGAVTTIAEGLSELRNRGHGTGHGPATARVGLRPRHAHLAVNAATTWCQLMLDTLADPEAPWRRASFPEVPGSRPLEQSAGSSASERA